MHAVIEGHPFRSVAALLREPATVGADLLYAIIRDGIVDGAIGAASDGNAKHKSE
jgi:hypothetical protein